MAFSDGQSSATIIFGESPSTIELEEACVVGDCLGFSAGWYKALATTGSVVQMRCVAAEAGSAGQKITGYFGITILRGRLSGGTAGAALYVAEGTSDGQYTETAPTTSGDANKKVGYMISATEAVLLPNYNDDSVA